MELAPGWACEHPNHSPRDRESRVGSYVTTQSSHGQLGFGHGQGKGQGRIYLMRERPLLLLLLLLVLVCGAHLRAAVAARDAAAMKKWRIVRLGFGTS